MKCPLCGSRKGKRRCPAVRAEICAVCCGTKRLVEIDCPDDCSWLSEGQRHEMAREWEEYARRQEPAKARRWLDVMQRLLPVIDALEQAVVDVAAAATDLTDTDALSALEALDREQGSEESGIVYQQASTSPRVEMLLRAFREKLEAMRSAVKEAGGGDVPAAAVRECIAVMGDRAAFHGQQVAGDSLVTHLRRVRRASRGDGGGEAPRIVMP